VETPSVKTGPAKKTDKKEGPTRQRKNGKALGRLPDIVLYWPWAIVHDSYDITALGSRERSGGRLVVLSTLLLPQFAFAGAAPIWRACRAQLRSCFGRP